MGLSSDAKPLRWTSREPQCGNLVSDEEISRVMKYAQTKTHAAQN